VTQEHRQKFQEELEKLIKSQWKVVALLMRDVLAMDETGVEDIQSLNEKLNSRGRFAAILDPSPSIEPLISEHKLEEKISIYGTEKAFEQEVFSIRRVNKTRILPIRK
jgi:anti-anti-sigma regulatory factor